MAELRLADPPPRARSGSGRSAPVRQQQIRQMGGMMAFVKLLAIFPFLGILVGVPLLNRVEPLVLGMPLILAWIVLWVLLTAVIMLVVYWCDPANRVGGDSRP
jgi:hypothetical protein